MSDCGKEYIFLFHLLLLERTLKKWRCKDTALVICGVALFLLLFSFLNLYVIPSVCDYIAEEYAVTYFPGVGPLEFSLIEGVLCIFFGIISLVMQCFIQVYDLSLLLVTTRRLYSSKLEREAFLKSTPFTRTGFSLIITGIILVVLYFIIPP